MMVKSLILFAFLFSVSAVKGQNSVNGIIEFNKMIHDFGDISLNSGNHSYTFIFKNIGKQPIIINTVISSCGCTTPVWTKNPVLPGENGKIDVTFLNDQGPYPFDKSLTVYVSGLNRPVILRIKGVVHEKPKSLSQLFPVKIGKLAFKKNHIEIGIISQGELKNDVIEVANTSGTPVEIGFYDLTAGLSIRAVPPVINPGKKGELHITVNTAGTKNWGTTKYTTGFIVNKNKVSGSLLTVQARILDNFSSLSTEDRDHAALPMANSSAFNFGIVKSGEFVNRTFELKNLGQRDLIIYKAESNENSAKTKYSSPVKPGQTGKIDVTIDTKTLEGDKTIQITLITNSPSRPVVNLLVSGNISK
ncbi:MAG: DUF1573 domain-containing protein [Ignavibacteria bacterium]|nr:DUF1573 domain-containing protein [Ignavibacteria bacterium]